MEINGEYRCMGDLGMHAVHLPLRAGWAPRSVYAMLSNVFTERPGKDGALVPCDTWDDAILATEVESADQRFPMIVETKRIVPGDTNTWYIEVLGTECSMAFSTEYPRTLRLMEYQPGGEQAWQNVALGFNSAYRTITNSKFEFGFADAFLQMCGAFMDELANGAEMIKPFGCAILQEAELSHRIFTAALKSEKDRAVAEVREPVRTA